MYEVWVSDEDPGFHMVQKVGSEPPLFFDPRTWTRLGITDNVERTLLLEIRGLGFATITRLGTVFDPEEEFG